ncbi:MAG TPA: DUF2076 family protein [Steroidobacteraceae bacterium]|nr:DUF2076 family protein [Steroidobacteraceae bacterium]
MNSRELLVLQDFLEQLVRVREVEKNSQAEAMIDRALAQQPDAAYLLVQRALLLQQALERAKARIAALEELARPLTESGDHGWLDADRSRVQGVPPAASNSVPHTAASSPFPAEGSRTAGVFPPNAAPANAPASLLGQAAATAAGVAGGAFLFEGLENLIGHHSAGLTADAGMIPAENLTVNNFYESDLPADNAHHWAGSADDVAAANLDDTDDDLMI